jgi:FlaA1/EpsC-like NDP-sugar epimerase
MGTAININEMAHELIKLSGLEPNVDIKIEFTGLRPGEKLYEELITEGEGILPTRHEKILVLEGHTCDLADLAPNVNRLEQLAIAQDGDGIRKALSRMLPEYTPAVITAGNAGIQPASCEVAAVHKTAHF